MLEQMKRRLHAEFGFEQAVDRILDDVVALNGAEYGTLQLSVGDRLVIVAQRGFRPPFLDRFRMVRRQDDSAWDRALRSGQTVLIEDVEEDEEFAPFRSDAETAGYRSVVTRPLLVEGQLLGTVSTHFARPHRPTAIEIETFEQYSVLAARYLKLLLGNESVARLALRMSNRVYGPAPYRDLAS